MADAVYWEEEEEKGNNLKPGTNYILAQKALQVHT